MEESLRDTLTIQQVARETNMSVPFWRKQVLHKRVRYVKCGRSVRIRRADLERWLAARLVGEEQ